MTTLLCELPPLIVYDELSILELEVVATGASVVAAAGVDALPNSLCLKDPPGM